MSIYTCLAIIATPPDSHKEYALKVAAAGKICCIEKPLAPSFVDCQAIQAAFADASVPLFVAYYRRSLPRFLKVKTLLEEAAIGDIRHIQWNLSRPPSEIDLTGRLNWRTQKEVAAAGYFDDLASHGLDLFAFLLGDFASVSGTACNQQDLYTAFDAVSACWQHASGVTGAGFWNFGSFTSQDKVTIYGSKGELNFSIFDEAPVHLLTSSLDESFDIAHPENVQLHHVENMAKQLFDSSVNPSSVHPSTGDSATHTAWVMSQILSA